MWLPAFATPDKCPTNAEMSDAQAACTLIDSAHLEAASEIIAAARANDWRTPATLVEHLALLANEVCFPRQFMVARSMAIPAWPKR
mmetsp:Transcript_52981/g.113656  ORF Transcript_52981/g.113656 Transcript_52981/m.113656 type:complete len:86 (+) Transcript_52981:690-947(+)